MCNSDEAAQIRDQGLKLCLKILVGEMAPENALDFGAKAASKPPPPPPAPLAPPASALPPKRMASFQDELREKLR